MNRSKLMASLSAGLFTVLAASACGASGGHSAQVGNQSAPSSSAATSANPTTPPTTLGSSSPFSSTSGSGSSGSTTGGSGATTTTSTTSPSQSAAAAASLNAVQQDLNGIDSASNQAASDLNAGQSAQAQNDSP